MTTAPKEKREILLIFKDWAHLHRYRILLSPFEEKVWISGAEDERGIWRALSKNPDICLIIVDTDYVPPSLTEKLVPKIRKTFTGPIIVSFPEQIVGKHLLEAGCNWRAIGEEALLNKVKEVLEL